MAGSGYPTELAAWIEKRQAKKRRRDTAAVAFLAVRADVKAAMDSGYAVTTIYEHMRETGRAKCNYETFRKHVQRYIKEAPAAPGTPTAVSKASQGKDAKPAPRPTLTAPESSKSEPSKIGGFTFDATPNKEDLL